MEADRSDYAFNDNDYIALEDIFYTEDSDEDTEYLIATKQQDDLLFIFVSDGYFCNLYTYNNIETTYQGTPVNFTRHTTYSKHLDVPSVVVEFKTTDIQTLQTVKTIMFSFIYDYENYSDLDGKFNSKVFHEEEPYYNDINKEYAVYLIEKTLEEAEDLEKE